MKSGIHPQVHNDAKVTCLACGAVFEIPSVIQEQSVEACRLCHPAYTGKQTVEAKGGRIERFRRRVAAKGE